MSKYLALVTQEGEHLVVSPIHSVDNSPIHPQPPVDPGYGVGHPRPPHISIRPPHAPAPPTIWPPVVDNSLPYPPLEIWGGEAPPLVDNTLPPFPPTAGQLPVFPGTPEHPIAAPPGTVWPPLPVDPGYGVGHPTDPDKKLVIVFIPGVGYRYVVVDTSIKVDNTLPTPEPK